MIVLPQLSRTNAVSTASFFSYRHDNPWRSVLPDDAEHSRLTIHSFSPNPLFARMSNEPVAFYAIHGGFDVGERRAVDVVLLGLLDQFIGVALKRAGKHAKIGIFGNRGDFPFSGLAQPFERPGVLLDRGELFQRQTLKDILGNTEFLSMNSLRVCFGTGCPPLVAVSTTTPTVSPARTRPSEPGIETFTASSPCICLLGGEPDKFMALDATHRDLEVCERGALDVVPPWPAWPARRRGAGIPWSGRRNRSHWGS